MRKTLKFQLLFLLVIPMLFQACGDDDEITRQDLLTGTWVIESAELSDYTVTLNVGIPLTITKENASSFGEEFGPLIESFEQSLSALASELFPSGTTISFNDDNTYILTSPGDAGSINNTWSLSADEQEITVLLDDDDVADDSLDRLVFNISELSNDSLMLMLSIGDDQLQLETGDDVTVEDFTIEYTFSFNKQ